MSSSGSDELLTRRQWLIVQAVVNGATMFAASEAVASTALAHPEWDMDEQRTRREWQASS